MRPKSADFRGEWLLILPKDSAGLTEEPEGCTDSGISPLEYVGDAGSVHCPR